MPSYVWKCKFCRVETEIQSPMSESHLPPQYCPGCKLQDGDFDRVYGSFAFSLKGGGWYRDSYAKKPKEKS